MSEGMSISLFANPKAALGFAGVTIAIAVAASFGVGAFLPGEDNEAESPAVEEAASQPASEPARVASTGPAAAGSAWGSGGSGNGWGAQFDDTTKPTSTVSEPSLEDSPGSQADFGSFEPDRQEGRSNRRTRPPQSGPAPRSRAAANAPPLPPPAGGPAPALETAE